MRRFINDIRNKVQDKFCTWKQVNKGTARQKRERIYNSIDDLLCDSINIDVPGFMLGGAIGLYNPSSQHISAYQQVGGALLVDTLYHEDRHYWQHMVSTKNWQKSRYIECTTNLKGYYKQHLEVDARRYAYVKTCKYLQSNGWTISILLYRLFYNHFRGLAHRKYR